MRLPPLNKHSGYTQILLDLPETDPLLLLLKMAGLFKYKTNFLKTQSFAYKGDAMYVPSGSTRNHAPMYKWNTDTRKKFQFYGNQSSVSTPKPYTLS